MAEIAHQVAQQPGPRRLISVAAGDEADFEAPAAIVVAGKGTPFPAATLKMGRGENKRGGYYVFDIGFYHSMGFVFLFKRCYGCFFEPL